MEEATQILAREIINLGRDDKERAKALGVSLRTITDYKAGKFPRIITSLLEKRIVVLRERIVAGKRGRKHTAQAGEETAQLGML
jgi:hypothetical protein